MSALAELLQDHAALYAAGVLSARERAQFDLILQFHEELRAMVRNFEQAAADTAFRPQQHDPQPCPTLKSRVLEQVTARKQRTAGEGFVIANGDGLVEWVNGAFVGMCGYTLDELKGKKLGPILQGPLTDATAAARMRAAVHAHKSCTEALINYTKDGRPYWVAINITPIQDDNGDFLCFIAREHELPERFIG